MDRIRCALVGHGYWGRILERYILGHDGFELVCVQGRPQGRGDAAGELPAMLGLDAAFICTPADTHYRIAREFLLAGVHVFCEKPLAKGLGEVRDLAALAGGRGLCLYTDYTYTVSRSIRFLKEGLPHIGGLKYIKGEISQFGRFYPNDTVYDVLGVHLLSVVAYLTGCRVKGAEVLYRHEAWRDEDGNTQEAAVAIRLPGPVEALLEMSLVSNGKRREIKAVGTEGMLTFDMLGETTASEVVLERGPAGYAVAGRRAERFDEGNNLALALDEFHGMVRSGGSGNVELAEAVAYLLERVKGDGAR